MKVILISGKAQHGKDTTAIILKEKLEGTGSKVLTIHFADLVKFVCKNYFNWDGEKDERGRTLLQYVGTDVVRKKNPDYWVDFVGTMLTYFNGEWDYVLVPDCRFPNEVDGLRKFGLDTIHVRVLRQNFNSTLTYEQQNHLSETALDNTMPDSYINNYGSLDELETIISKWIKENLHESNS